MTEHAPTPWPDAIAVTPYEGGWRAQIHEGWDIFGVPHGGYVLALVGNAVLHGSGQPDLFSLTVHYLRKTRVGPIDFEVVEVGGSRRFTSVRFAARQGDRVVLGGVALLGDRTATTGPAWSAAPPPTLTEADLHPEAVGPRGGPPAVVQRTGFRMDTRTLGFATGGPRDRAVVRGIATSLPAEPLAALLACDLTPPAAWNVLGVEGWVPTLELTAHVRATPRAGPLRVDAETRHIAGGFLEEDALVYDGEGTLVVQSRQLAVWTQAKR